MASRQFDKFLSAIREGGKGRGPLAGPLARSEVVELPRPSRVKSKEAVAKVAAIKKCELPSCKNKDRHPAFHVHHIQHRATSGADAEDNLLLVCAQCHFLIHDGKISNEELYAAVQNRAVKK